MRPAETCAAAFWRVTPSSLAFDMSTSPRTRAMATPSMSSNWTSASNRPLRLRVGRQLASQLDGRARRLAQDLHVVHQRLHQLQAAAPVLASGRSPLAVVADAHHHFIVAASRLELEARLAGR